MELFISIVFILFLYFSYYEIPVEFRLDFLPNFSVLLRFLFTLWNQSIASHVQFSNFFSQNSNFNPRNLIFFLPNSEIKVRIPRLLFSLLILNP